jgi:hypothetical protein
MYGLQGMPAGMQAVEFPESQADGKFRGLPESAQFAAEYVHDNSLSGS